MTKALTSPLVDEILRGIRSGRSLKQIEQTLGASAVDFLELIERDEGLNIRYKASLALSAYSLSSDLMEKLRTNLDEPESAVKNNALKLYMDHVHKEMDARNPAIFSGKAPINVSVPIQITTTLDLGQTKTLEGVYELKAEHVDEVETKELSILPGATGRGEPRGVAGAGAEDTSSPKVPAATPFSAALQEIPQEIYVGGVKKTTADSRTAAPLAETLEDKPPGQKPRRKRAVVRKKQALVEQSKKAKGQ